MELCYAKEFLYLGRDRKTIYISKNFESILEVASEINAKHMIDIYAIMETEKGDDLHHMDRRYDGEPFIYSWKRFLHLSFLLKYYSHYEVKRI